MVTCIYLACFEFLEIVYIVVFADIPTDWLEQWKSEK